jgi:Predicted oxidoreductases of the aldo/keto reductase family
VLSGMSSVEQMEDNLSYMKDFEGLTDEQRAVLDKAREAMAAIPIIPCTTCNYCAKVCPMNIGISGTFSAMNILTLYSNMARAANTEQFNVIMAGKKRANECIRCGKCEKVCPQHLPIRELLKKVAQTFEG